MQGKWFFSDCLALELDGKIDASACWARLDFYILVVKCQVIHEIFWSLEENAELIVAFEVWLIDFLMEVIIAI